MAEATKIEHAQLRELNPDFSAEKSGGKQITVQFNPETLKVSFANQIATPAGAGSQGGTSNRLFVGAGTTKLAVQLWFDISSLDDQSIQDVRDLTREVIFFITPKAEGSNFIPPAVRFIWGSFQFDGLVDSLEESLEFFSSDGHPLRANVSLNLSQQKIPEYKPPQRGAAGAGTGSAANRGAAGSAPASPVGTTPLTQAPSGSSLQQLAQAKGQSDWQSLAQANGIENPRILPPGRLLDLNKP
jgi:hypothetical protein